MTTRVWTPAQLAAKRAGDAIWRAKHREELKAYNAAYRATRPDYFKAYEAARWRTHREARTALNKAWHLAHPEKNKEYAATYRVRHREELRVANAAYYAANMEKARAATRAWHLANREKGREAWRTRRAHKIGNGIYTVTKRDWRRLVERYGGACAYCGQRGDLHQEHVVPLSRSGRHSIGNLLPACSWCNSSKHDRLLVEWQGRWAR